MAVRLLDPKSGTASRTWMSQVHASGSDYCAAVVVSSTWWDTRQRWIACAELMVYGSPVSWQVVDSSWWRSPPVPECYVPEERWDQLVSSLALQESREPNVGIRIPREVWPFSEPGGSVPDAALAADLLESPEPRSVSAGAERLNQLLAEWQQGRRRR